VNLLVDSHTLLWSYFEPARLSATAANELTDPSNCVFVSPASHWEIAIKMSIGKLQIAETFPDFVQHAIKDNGWSFLPIEASHSAELIGLPFRHRDPFDRLIIAQAIVEKMPIISIDSIFDAYPIRRIW